MEIESLIIKEGGVVSSESIYVHEIVRTYLIKHNNYSMYVRFHDDECVNVTIGFENGICKTVVDEFKPSFAKIKKYINLIRHNHVIDWNKFHTWEVFDNAYIVSDVKSLLMSNN